MERQLAAARTVLERRSDADSLAAAGLSRTVGGNSVAALSLLSRATALAPERADLAWLELQLCRNVPACDADAKSARLRALDPANGAAWFAAVTRASAANEEAPKLTVLSAMAHAQRVDIYWNTRIVHLTRALADTHKIPLQEALVGLVGVLAAQGVPAYSATSNLCKGDRLSNADVLEDCRGVAMALEQGDTAITQMIGLSIAKRVWPVDSPEWNAAAEARRVSSYRLTLTSKSEFAALSDSHSAARYLELCAQYRREQDVLRAELIDEGQSPDPPPDWVPATQ
jgi:hypothetical protein